MGNEKPRRLPGAVSSFTFRQGSEVFAVLGGAHFVEQFGDFEIGFGFGFGGEFLDRLARGLKFGFFDRTRDVQA